MASHGPKLIAPKGPSKSIFQPHPATVAQGPLPGSQTTTSPGHAGKSGPPNGGKSGPPNGGKPA